MYVCDVHVHMHEHIRTYIVHPLNCSFCTTVCELILSSEGKSNRRFHQPGMLHSPIITHFRVCLSVCLSICARSGKAWLVAASGTYGCFELAGLFASLLQKEAKRCQYYRQ